jgi:hypothetical protein
MSPSLSMYRALNGGRAASPSFFALTDGRPSLPKQICQLTPLRCCQRLATVVNNCASGRELISVGYTHDVEVAAELDGSSVVPRLQHEAFTSA